MVPIDRPVRERIGALRFTARAVSIFVEEVLDSQDGRSYSKSMPSKKIPALGTAGLIVAIESLRCEAARAGDTDMTDVCDRALDGETADLVECRRVLADARAAGQD